MKRLLFIFCIGLISAGATAQVDERFKKNPSKDSTETRTERRAEADPKPVVVKSTEQPWYKKLRFGGSASASFGTNTAVYLAPNVGYQVSDKFMPGLGFIYLYQRTNVAFDINTGSLYRLKNPYSTSMYGPAAFANFYPLDFIQLSARGEYLFHDVAEYNSFSGEVEDVRTASPVLFLGGAFYQAFEGGRGGFQIGIQYNVLHTGDGRDPYASAWWPVIGIMF